MMNSTRFAVMIATRSPVETPRAIEVPGKGVAALVQLAEGPAFVAGPDGVPVPEPVRGALELLMDGDGHRKHSSLI